ncbi:MAG TPA: tetratricopeptide repeat protein, partial [Gemmatimonadaceae bacterium]
LEDAGSRPGAKAATFHNLALALERVGKYPEALTALQDASKRGGSRDARIQTSIGIVSLMTGDLQTADRTLTAAKSLWPKTPAIAWYHYAALSAALLGDVPRAEALLAEGLTQHSRGVACLHNNHAALLERKGAYDEALAAAEQGLTDDPSIAQLHKNIGDLYYRANRFDEALPAYERAVKADPELGDDVYARLGNIRLRRQEKEEAIKHWTKALELDPGNTIVKNNLESLKQSR